MLYNFERIVFPVFSISEVFSFCLSSAFRSCSLLINIAGSFLFAYSSSKKVADLGVFLFDPALSAAFGGFSL
jgi:hypothetical protein